MFVGTIKRCAVAIAGGLSGYITYMFVGTIKLGHRDCYELTGYITPIFVSAIKQDDGTQLNNVSYIIPIFVNAIKCKKIEPPKLYYIQGE